MKLKSLINKVTYAECICGNGMLKITRKKGGWSRIQCNSCGKDRRVKSVKLHTKDW